jgi:hypothetical protein
MDELQQLGANNYWPYPAFAHSFVPGLLYVVPGSSVSVTVARSW